MVCREVGRYPHWQAMWCFQNSIHLPDLQADRQDHFTHTSPSQGLDTASSDWYDRPKAASQEANSEVRENTETPEMRMHYTFPRITGAPPKRATRRWWDIPPV